MGSTEPRMNSSPQPQHLLVFGATGSIGQSVCTAALGRGWQVTGVARTLPNKPHDGVNFLQLDPLEPSADLSALAPRVPYTGVCWAQGANQNDSVYDVALARHLEIYSANVAYILVTLKALLQGDMLAQAARMCVISSIWQNLARQSKLSYCVSKAALQGLVLSASADLAGDGHLINAVLPGALETPMTRRNLAADQIERIAGATGFGRLTSLEDVASLVCYLCSKENTGITGQFIAADLGFSHVRIV
jgi:3-oxoacyl-[acyl-carrier protein] reductase